MKISEDNPEQTNGSEDNLNQQGQEIATHATQSQVRFQSTATQELSTSAHQDSIEISQMVLQERVGTQNQQMATHAITQVPTMTGAELAMYHHQSLGNPRKDALLRALKRLTYPVVLKLKGSIPW